MDATTEIRWCPVVLLLKHNIRCPLPVSAHLESLSLKFKISDEDKRKFLNMRRNAFVQINLPSCIFGSLNTGLCFIWL